MSNKRNKKKTRPLKNWSISKCARYIDRYTEAVLMNPNGFRRFPAESDSGRLKNGRVKKKTFTDRVLGKLAAEERKI